MHMVACLEMVVAPPIMPRVVCLLRTDLSREDFAAHHGNAQFQALGHVRLKNEGAIADGLRISHVALGDDLGVTAKALVAVSAHGETSHLADNLTVVATVELQEVIGAVGEESRWELKTQCPCDAELGGLELGALDYKVLCRKPQAIGGVPGVIQETQPFLEHVF